MVQNPAQIRSGSMLEFKEGLGEEAIEKVFFYGAGLRTSDKSQLIKDILTENIPDAEIHVHHDLLGAARATCGTEQGISCILGTGSNSCWFDGTKITHEIGGHGYLLGDEGSGADLGKSLLQACLNNELPPKLIEEFESWAGKSILQIRNEAYAHPRANYFFAGFSKFIGKRIADPSLDALVLSRFNTFFTKTVMRYGNYSETKVHFVGSVASIYEQQLRKSCELMHLQMGRTLRAPADTLVDFHTANL